MAGGDWNVGREGTMVALAFRLGPPIVRNGGNSWSRGNDPVLSLFIQHLHEPWVRSAGARGYLWSAGNFSLDCCLAHSREVSKKCLLNESVNENACRLETHS